MSDSLMKPSIDSIIEQALSATEHGEPEQVAAEVLQKVSPTDYSLYLKQLVTSRVASIATEQKRKVAVVKRGPSMKQALIRDDYWPRYLNQPINLPDGRKKMGELTAPDLIWLAGNHRAQAHKLFGQAAQFEKLAEMMTAAKVAKLEQLPATTGERVLAS